MATSFEPTGDSIAAKLQDTTQTYSLSEVTQDLMDAHAHRPGLIGDDMKKATESLHEAGVLKDFEIVGINGKDLIARDTNFNTSVLVNTEDPTTMRALSSELTETPIGQHGRMASLAQDGSGNYTVSGGDSAWKVARDLLSTRGMESPTDNQIANYIIELEHHNERSLAQLQVGDVINVPPMIKDGEQTDFAPAPTPEPVTPEVVTPETETTDTETTDTVSPDTATEVSPEVVTPEVTPEVTTEVVPDTVVDATFDSLENMPLTQGMADAQKAIVELTEDDLAVGYELARQGFQVLGVGTNWTDKTSISNAMAVEGRSESEIKALATLLEKYDEIRTSDDGYLYPGDIADWRQVQLKKIDDALAAASPPVQ